ncbi:MAG: hypothetical protein OCD02_02825 [Spirochaetaceae bacterium]
MFDKEILEKDGECIEMTFGANWNYISITRQFIQNFVLISSGDQARSDHFSTSISELLENAIKYSTNNKPYLFVHVDKVNGTLTGIVENFASDEAISGLQVLYDKVMIGTPMEAYVEQMKLAATRDDGKSQLGLARIRFEAGAQLDMKISEDNKISLRIVM